VAEVRGFYAVLRRQQGSDWPIHSHVALTLARQSASAGSRA
jgi:hypothetical protein